MGSTHSESQFKGMIADLEKLMFKPRYYTETIEQPTIEQPSIIIQDLFFSWIE